MNGRLAQKRKAASLLMSGFTVDEMREVGSEGFLDLMKEMEGLDEAALAKLTSPDKKIPRRAKAIYGHETRTERRRWLWEGRLALGEFTILDGNPDLGKTALWCRIVAHVTTGTPLPGESKRRKKARRVLVLAGEDDIGKDLRPRLIAAGADMKNVVFMEMDDGEEFTEDFDISDLADIAELLRLVKTERIDLLVIDPIMAYIGKETRSGIDNAVRRAINPLCKVAKRNDVAILAIRHLNKETKNKDPMTRGGGSIAFTGKARIVMMVGCMEDTTTAPLPDGDGDGDAAPAPTQYFLAVVKANNVRNDRKRTIAYQLHEAYVPPQEKGDAAVHIVRVELGGESNVQAWQLLDSVKTAKEPTATEKVEQIFRDQCAQHGCTSTVEVEYWAGLENISKATVRKTLNKMETGMEHRGGGGRQILLRWQVEYPPKNATKQNAERRGLNALEQIKGSKNATARDAWAADEGGATVGAD